MDQKISWRGSHFSIRASGTDAIVTRLEPGASQPTWETSFRANFSSWHDLVDSWSCQLTVEEPYVIAFTNGNHCKDGSLGDFAYHLLTLDGKHLWTASAPVSLVKMFPLGLLTVEHLVDFKSNAPQNPVVRLALLDPETQVTKNYCLLEAPPEALSKGGKPAYSMQSSLSEREGEVVLSLTFIHVAPLEVPTIEYRVPFLVR